MHTILALKTQLKIAPQQVMASTLLQVAIVDLNQLLAKELAANPALERVEPEAATIPHYGCRCACWCALSPDCGADTHALASPLSRRD